MTICSTTNLHNVVSVTVERKRFKDFRTLALTFTTADGNVLTVDAFSDEPLQIADADEVPVNQEAATA